MEVHAPIAAARWVDCTIQVEDFRDLTAVVARTRRLFDLDADPVSVDGVLRSDPVLRRGVEERPASACLATSTATRLPSAPCSVSR